MSTHIRGYDAWKTAAPDYDGGPCNAQSPNGKHACTLGYDHPLAIDHAAHVPVEKWSQATEGDADHLGCKVGDWIAASSYGGEAYVTIASWPQRDDDFDDGTPADRKAQWAARHAQPVEKPSMARSEYKDRDHYLGREKVW